MHHGLASVCSLAEKKGDETESLLEKYREGKKEN